MTESLQSKVEVSDDLVSLVRQAQEGSADAVRLVYDRCREPLLMVIRKVIPQPVRRLEDSEDFLQATFTQVFTKHFSDEVLRGPETLWPYLKRIAENQVRDARRKYLVAEKHQLCRDVPLEILGNQHEALQCRDFSPHEALILKELVQDRLDDLIRKLPSPLRPIVKLLLEGYSGAEIAHQLDIEMKRVYRAIGWLKKQVMKE
ncbi:MAG TPA: sigma-70 family RNA polymerase sigma factor [Gemmataceae bacterium]|nr:sigma-70 family RNA polymerase sigma factor [Gemmataceae bacterium]